jgi:hypothetical protein
MGNLTPEQIAQRDKARLIKDEIGEKFKGKRWFGGVGIGVEKGEYYVRLYCSRWPLFCRVPNEIDGVRVDMQRIEKVIVQTIREL